MFLCLRLPACLWIVEELVVVVVVVVVVVGMVSIRGRLLGVSVHGKGFFGFRLVEGFLGSDDSRVKRVLGVSIRGSFFWGVHSWKAFGVAIHGKGFWSFDS